MYPLDNKEEKRAKSQRLEAARQIIEEHTIFKLSREDSIEFVESLLNPLPLADDTPLARALNRYKQSQKGRTQSLVSS